MNSKISWVVFDLGGVIVDIDIVSPLKKLTSLLPRFKGEPSWFYTDPASPLKQLVRGQISTAECARLVSERFGGSVSDAEFCRIEMGVLLGERSYMVDLLERLRGRYQLACLSNTHALHWDYMLASYRAFSIFQQRFASHELGLIKPDPEIYRAALERMGAPAAEVLFIDDLEENVQAAARCGIQAIHYSDFEKLKADLVSCGVLLQ